MKKTYITEKNADLKYIGQQIRRARNARNMTQAQLAEKVNLAQNYVGMIERGAGKPDLPTLIDIAEVLGVNFDYLMGRCANRECNSDCQEYEKQIISIVKTLNKQQMLFLLDIIELMQKYGHIGDTNL